MRGLHNRKNNKILSLGSLNIDLIYKVPHIVRPGETLSSEGISQNVGGKGLNQSIALSKAGSKVYHAGAIGKEDGQMLIEQLAAHGVNTDYILEKDMLSGNALIQVDSSGQNSILLYDGANKSLTIDEVEHILSGFSSGDYIVLQNEINQLPAIISLASQKNMTIFFNPSPLNEVVFECDLSQVSWFFLNEIEAAQLSGQEAYDEETLTILIKKYPAAHFVITLGEKGSLCYYDGKLYKQGIHQVDAVDTTGAGDTYTGYFIATFQETGDIELALKYASIASAIAVSRPGASSSIPSIDEVKKFGKID